MNQDVAPMEQHRNDNAATRGLFRQGKLVNCLLGPTSLKIHCNDNKPIWVC
jgi:hypothetical protein